MSSDPLDKWREKLLRVDAKRWTREAEATAVYHTAIAESARRYVTDLVDELYPDEAEKPQT